MWSEVWNVLLELSPFLLLGAVFAGILHVVLPPGFVARHLTGRGGVARAVLLGVPLPLCSCGVIPAGLGLRKDGASKGASLAFLISTPQTGVDSVLVSAGFLGWPFALFKVASAALTGMVGGFVTDRLEPSDDVGPEHAAAAGTHDAALESRRTLRDGVDHGVDLLRTIWRWLVFGVVASAAITYFVPPAALTGLAGLGIVATTVVVLGISVPLYVCATASVPIAASLVAAGLPTSAALIFLMAGPATNVATMGAVKRAFGGRVLAIYLATVIVGSTVLGFAFDALFGATVAQAMHHGDHGSWWQVASAVGLLVLLGWFAMDDVRQLVRERQARAKAEALELSVEGMSCGGCARRLERVLGELPAVDSASVSFDEACARVAGQMSESDVVRAIEGAGFTVRR